MKKRKFSVPIIFLIMAIAFLLPLIFLSSFITNHFKYKNILENGIETTATIISGTASSNVEVNNVKYYSIAFVFLDESGVEHIGRTSINYDYFDIIEIENNKTIEIKYLSETYESIESTYKMGPGEKGSFIIFIVFSFVDIIFWVIVIISLIRKIKQNKVLKDGIEYTALYTSMSSNLMVNNVPMYKIGYCWTDINGEDNYGTSEHDYTFNEAIAFESAGEFKIKAIDKDSVIITKPSKLITYRNNAKLNSSAEELYYTCAYCNAMYKKDKLRCPSCGANQYKE